MLDNKITLESLNNWLEHPVTKTVYSALEKEKSHFSNSLLESGILHLDYMDRFVALKLGAMEQIDVLLVKESLLQLLEQHSLLVNKSEEDDEASHAGDRS